MSKFCTCCGSFKLVEVLGLLQCSECNTILEDEEVGTDEEEIIDGYDLIYNQGEDY